MANASAATPSGSASSDADVQGYDVYRYAPSPASENSYVKINSALISDTQYLVADASETPAYYRVKAVDRSANLSASSTCDVPSDVSPLHL